MNKRALINLLEAHPFPDDAEIVVMVPYDLFDTGTAPVTQLETSKFPPTILLRESRESTD